ncbi:peptidoglycan editing factor PgeF [Pseudoalteromonas sp.]|uniref:peptidoglycan editing factor PgeF n=1 Tax=Pseudoalteromonas sp. TaxID=53249 RepID=UPI003562E491
MQLLSATWGIPATVVGTLSTTRSGGVSLPPFASLNLGLHVGDNTQQVLQNRAKLTAHLPQPAVWLNQTHSVDVVIVDQQLDCTRVHDGDALYTRLACQPLAIMTADCLPILLASNNGKEVAAIHGGWRGLLNGIVKNTVNCFSAPPTAIEAWLGPAIGAKKFVVGAEVYQQFVTQNPIFAAAFTRHSEQKYLADIYQLARLLLRQCGVKHISGGEHCTVSQPATFFSYRRDGQTGRMATVIWRK